MAQKFITLVLLSSIFSLAAAQTSHQQARPSDEDLVDAYPEVAAQNAIGTRLIKYT